MENRMTNFNVLNELDNLNPEQLKSLVRTLAATVGELNDFVALMGTMHRDNLTQLAVSTIASVALDDTIKCIATVYGEDHPGVAQGRALQKGINQEIANLTGQTVEDIEATSRAAGVGV
jgi:hypothetical protein